MANQLATFDKTPSNLTQTDRRAYPWNEWLDGHVWEIRFDEDFTAHPLMMERIIRTRATAKKAKVEIRHRQLNGSNKVLGDGCGIIVLRRSDIAQPRKAASKATKTPAKKVATKKAATNGSTKVNGSAKKAATTKMTPAKKAVATRSKKAARA